MLSLSPSTLRNSRVRLPNSKTNVGSSVLKLFYDILSSFKLLRPTGGVVSNRSKVNRFKLAQFGSAFFLRKFQMMNLGCHALYLVGIYGIVFKDKMSEGPTFG
jgi:hypothetical protein